MCIRDSSHSPRALASGGQWNVKIIESPLIYGKRYLFYLRLHAETVVFPFCIFTNSLTMSPLVNAPPKLEPHLWFPPIQKPPSKSSTGSSLIVKELIQALKSKLNQSKGISWIWLAHGWLICRSSVYWRSFEGENIIFKINFCLRKTFC